MEPYETNTSKGKNLRQAIIMFKELIRRLPRIPMYCSVLLVEANLEEKHNTNSYGRDGCEKLVQKIQNRSEDKNEKLYRYS